MLVSLTVLLWAVAGFLVLAALLPLSKIAHGAIQGLAFPRAQFLAASLLCAGLLLLLNPSGLGLWSAGVMAMVAAGHAAYIAKFTPLWRRQSVKAAGALMQQPARHVSLLAANVKMSNRAYGRLIDLIRAQAPDLVMAIEVDAQWITALKSALSDEFDHWIEVPKDNGYGLCVMSRLVLSDVEQRDLVTRDVPSIRARVQLRSGQDIRLHVVHPEPPVINHDTIGRDSEIALVGLEAAADELPVIVTGDLNDVAWSTTTRRFQRLSQLLDPRVGRGFYNTFSATMPLMRWPLDHLFHDKRFRLIEMARMPKIGSDHFAMWFKLALGDQESQGAALDTAEPDEFVQTQQMIQDEQRRPRGPIGEDWESD